MKRTHKGDKELTEIQGLKKLNKKLREENSSLKRRIRKLEKQEHYYEVTHYQDEEEIEEIPCARKCEKCFKGDIEIISIVGRTWSQCTMCDFRTATVKYNEKN